MTLKTSIQLLAALIFLGCKPKVFNMSGPAMESTIMTDTKIYIDRDKSPVRNDIIAYHMPSDVSSVFVLRMIAQPGDTLQILNGQIAINGEPVEDAPGVQFNYYLSTRKPVNEQFFIGNGINAFSSIQDGYLVFTTEQNASELKKQKFITSISRVIDSVDTKTPNLFDDFQGWNKDNLGPLYVPKAGDRLSAEHLVRYASTIEKFENTDISGLGEYTFRKSYCFVMGDNRDNAMDSRYIGLIPMDQVMGTVHVLF